MIITIVKGATGASGDVLALGVSLKKLTGKRRTRISKITENKRTSIFYNFLSLRSMIDRKLMEKENKL